MTGVHQKCVKNASKIRQHVSYWEKRKNTFGGEHLLADTECSSDQLRPMSESQGLQRAVRQLQGILQETLDGSMSLSDLVIISAIRISIIQVMRLQRPQSVGHSPARRATRASA